VKVDVRNVWVDDPEDLAESLSDGWTVIAATHHRGGENGGHWVDGGWAVLLRKDSDATP
jgi:hypothetical protein